MSVSKTCPAAMTAASRGPAARMPASANVFTRSPPLDDIAARGRIENRAAVEWMMVEIGSYPDCGQFFENILFTRPIFETLEIVVEPVAHPIFPLAYNDLPTATRQHDRAGKASWTGPDDTYPRRVRHRSVRRSSGSFPDDAVNANVGVSGFPPGSRRDHLELWYDDAESRLPWLRAVPSPC